MNATATTSSRNAHDHRLRSFVHSTGDIDLALQQGVRPSTARGWRNRPPKEVISAHVVDLETVQLQQQVLALRRRRRHLFAVLRILILLWKHSGFFFARLRIPGRATKLTLLRTIERSRSVLSLRLVLRILRLSPSRYHAWKPEEECGLEDASSCPRSSPQQLTAKEVSAIHDMVMSDEYRHVSTGTLARLAARLRTVFASSSTWYRLINAFQWRRPRKRVHPAQPKVGIRAYRPNEFRHVDTTLIRLLNGGRAYPHAVIDNFSRRILAWKVLDNFDPSVTSELLLNASKGVVDQTPSLLADGGVENFNSAVDELVESGLLKRLPTITDISSSNSLIESWWRILKHQWLYLNTRDSVSTIQTLVEFYVNEHNTRLPHSAFRGQTPDEMYFGTGANVPAELKAARKSARQVRIEANRKRSCPKCDPLVQLPS